MNVKVIYEDKNMLLAIKPVGVPAQADKTGDEDMVTYFEKKHGKEISVINRLDRPVEGIMIFGKNRKTAAALSKQIQENTLGKGYLAVICGVPEKEEDVFEDYLLKNQRQNISEVVSKDKKDSKKAVLSYRLIGTIDSEEGKLSLVKINLETGRHHQIRVQFASRNLPLWGDTKYNKIQKRSGLGYIGLSSCEVKFTNPTKNKYMEFHYTPTSGIFAEFKELTANLF